ncbi:hypothetical protein [Stomatohabitans albus]|uniref:hypothetical protein n=1 Tax=Stomatohabitans albus TaxID=3110766 RepID=UPI00300DA5F3
MRSRRFSSFSIRSLSVLLVLTVGLAGCTGADPYNGDDYAFPSISEMSSRMPRASDVNAANVRNGLNELLAHDRPSPEQVSELTRIADQVVSSAAQRLGTTPEAFEQMSPKEVAELVYQANVQSNHAIEASLRQLEAMTPKQRALVAQSAQTAISGALGSVAQQAQSALGNRAGVVRIGVNELGGYAASAAYLWVYLLQLAGYTTHVEVVSGAELAERLNANELDITFEAVPEFLASETATLGVWSEGRLNVQGRADLRADMPEVADGLDRFALDKAQMRSLAAVVSTRGVADPVTQEAAVQLWIVDHPELLKRIAGQ